MSKELLGKFNQVLRPYYAQMTRPGISDLAALQDFLARFCADQQIIQLLATTNPEIQELQDLLPGNNSAILGHFFKIRLFQHQFSQALATTLLQQAPSNELDAIGNFFTQKTQINLANRSDVYDSAQLSGILCLLYASYAHDNLEQAGIAHAYALPAAKVATDLNPDALSPALFTTTTQPLNTLYSIASRPEHIAFINNLKYPSDKLKQHVLLKSYLRAPSGMKIYYDAAGLAYLNRLPVGTPANNFFLTRTFAVLLKDTKADLLKFALNDETLRMFTHSENTKALNKNNVSVVVTCQLDEANPTAMRNVFDLQQEFADCASLIKLVRYFKDLKKAYDLQLQFAVSSYSRLQLACVPQA